MSDNTEVILTFPAVGDSVSPPPKKKSRGKTREGLTVSQKFWERLKREGRYDLWHPTLKRMQQERGLGFGQAKWAAMRELGYTEAKFEHDAHQVFTDQQEKIEVQKNTQQAAKDFESACAGLPDEASVATEIAWVRSHPAMSRLDRMPGGIGTVLITPDDILSPPHGKAPSKSAVGLLQHYANRPHEFFKALMSEQKKITGETDKPKQEEDTDLAEVERLLREIQVG